eukprot:CAMPEP_0196723072 /NCGR_PEP_ID=MMETSP1091-20130531/5246_1 /TAXON_ID=302021 /ORGANISM="Rhodomonas sp., Strain CCMP768" /LENGTH=297 /DNA_ID=CAMNT_0042064899 /DNA_START=27 /DNA_END=920 /DNA_ORIENTATION=+
MAHTMDRDSWFYESGLIAPDFTSLADDWQSSFNDLFRTEQTDCASIFPDQSREPEAWAGDTLPDFERLFSDDVMEWPRSQLHDLEDAKIVCDDEPCPSASCEELGAKRKLNITHDGDSEDLANKRCKQDSSAVGIGRGAHMKDRPELQQTARDGQRHWASKAVELRKQWSEKRMWERHEAFAGQIEICRQQHMKSQNECLLRQLQVALVDGLIVADGFSPDGSESFAGWTGFAVVPEHSSEFRRRLQEMFFHPPLDKTLNNTMRRAGLQPQRGWYEAWSGLSGFEYRRLQKRSPESN